MLLTGLPAHAEHFWKETDVKTVHRSYLGAQVGETLIFQWALFSPEREMFNSIYILLLFFFFFSKNVYTQNNSSKMYPEKPSSRSQASDSLGPEPRCLGFSVSSTALRSALQNRQSA